MIFKNEKEKKKREKPENQHITGSIADGSQVGMSTDPYA